MLSAPLESIGSPLLWAVTVIALLVLFGIDLALTRRPHEVSTREAMGWTVFYLALPLAFGMFIWLAHDATQSLQFFTGYVVEKSLSVDNLFVFMLMLAAFAVPSEIAQRVLLYGIGCALVLRAVFIAAGAAVLSTGTWAFLLFGTILVVTAAKVTRDAHRGVKQHVDVDRMRSVRLLRRLMPVVSDYHGTRLTVRAEGRRALTPMALVVVAVFIADVVFAVDSVPAVYGVTSDPYLVFVTNAFALLGLRALYFVLRNALSAVRHLNYGLGFILGFIGAKLILHWVHGLWNWIPDVPTLLSLGVIIATLVVVTATSALANRRDARRESSDTLDSPIKRGA
ncbi:MAG TPA: TerC/Alx family metal homeostasis membrane protein [Micromonosporaceae bacterium]|nr:TerC/Alx family metal homeostasis membrane protein [Micromonosporaceae bacterium]